MTRRRWISAGALMLALSPAAAALADVTVPNEVGKGMKQYQYTDDAGNGRCAGQSFVYFRIREGALKYTVYNRSPGSTGPGTPFNATPHINDEFPGPGPLISRPPAGFHQYGGPGGEGPAPCYDFSGEFEVVSGTVTFPTPVIKGTVTNADGSPAANKQVFVDGPDGGGSSRVIVFTNSAGAYTTSPLDEIGTYFVETVDTKYCVTGFTDCKNKVNIDIPPDGVVNFVEPEKTATPTATPTASPFPAGTATPVPTPPAGSGRPTMTRGSCNRGPLPTDDAVCFATVADAGPEPRTAPRGTVLWRATRGGFVFSDACELQAVPGTVGISNCSVTYRPDSAGLIAGTRPPISASYRGSTVHLPSTDDLDGFSAASEKNDRIKGSGGPDLICGRGGNDRIDGLGGADTLYGDTCGPTALYGIVRAAVLGGNDRIDGGKGDDILFGGSGRDRLTGGPGVNAYDAGPGNDVVRARNGKRETVRCGAGKDRAIVDRKDRAKGCEKVKRPRRKRA